MYVYLLLKVSQFEVICTVTKMKGNYTHTHKSFKGKFTNFTPQKIYHKID